ncbi:MAG TPA: amylo-alpha-1,6-glucosidase [Thermodesulfobacteriota bacterium]|nr:amylo-alpha-1,6-glucosidase [Thermodesulfobacteriota bacterium]
MSIKFGREICGFLDSAEKREWLVTNGIGGFASGTVAGLLTRRYHGLLVAALKPPLGRTLLATKMDETVTYDGAQFPLYTNHWADGTVDPHGYRNIESFHLEGTIPVWKFACADAMLEKRIWMQQGANTTYIQYKLSRATGPLTLEIKSFINYRDYHGTTHGGNWRMGIDPVTHGFCVRAFSEAHPFYLLSDKAAASPTHDWYFEFNLAVEKYRGLDSQEDHLHAATFLVILNPGESLTLVVSTEESPNLDGEAALEQRHQYEGQLLERWKTSQSKEAVETPDWISQLVLSADQFIVNRPSSDEPNGKTVIAGYHWFGDWGRDTMISLPGLTICTGRTEVARSILRTFARYVDKGMLPNRFPDSGETPEYNTVDATLWYFEAIRAYHAATGDDELLSELFPVLAEIVDWHIRGTRYNIHVDQNDGLLYAGENGVQLTWMDSKIGDWVVTPRTGKAVEINALWYNALRTMMKFAKKLKKPSKDYEAAAKRTFMGFSRFWNNELGYCYDVIDTPDGNDPSLRPNQIFAVSLPESPLTPAQQRGVVEACARHLLTSHGLRSLAPNHPQYKGHYGGDSFHRDSVYHLGTVWGWLLGHFALAHLRVYNDPQKAREFLEPMSQHLLVHGVGSLSEIFDGDAPFTPRGCIAQAWTVAEVIRAWVEMRKRIVQ